MSIMEVLVLGFDNAFMFLQDSPETNLRQCAAKTVIQFLLFSSLSFSLILFSSPSNAAEQGAYRILVLHGEWQERTWSRDFDRLFSEAMLEAEGSKIEVSFQNLGIDKVLSPQTRTFYAQNIEGIIREQKIDMLVALLPAAVEFVLEIDSISDMPKILVLPPADLDYSSQTAGVMRVVESHGEEAIRKTIEAAMLLRPNAKTVEFFSGAGQTDLAYLSMAQELVKDFDEELGFKFHSGMPLNELTAYTSAVSDSSILVLLPYGVFSNGDSPNSFNFVPESTQAASGPVFGIVEAWVGAGITGGYVFSIGKYALATSQAASSLIHQLEERPSELRVTGDYVFDYNLVSRWALDLATLDDPYVLTNRPRSIFDDYSGFIYTIAVLVILLLAALFLQFLLLKRSGIAKRQLEASERQTRENEARFQLLTRNSLDVIWTWDGAKRQTTYCSPSIRQLLDYTPEEFLALPIRKIMTDDSTNTAMKKVFSKDNGAQVFEVDLVRKDGVIVACEIAAQPIEGARRSNFWVGVTRDISKRKEAEKEQLALESQVRQAQKFESLGTLAGGIAHDFNNILGVVMGLTELLKLKISDNEEAVQITDKLMTTADRAKAMVGQILAFSRQSAGSKKAANLNELLLESFQIMQTGMPKSISLEFNDAGASLNVLADSNQLSQVFINFLTNAYEAVDENAGKISVSVSLSALNEKTKFLHGELAQGRYALVKICDNGGGLTDDEIEKMFDPFYTSKELGNGMGLAIARGIIIGHDGAIDIESTQGSGTTVSLYMPVIEIDTELMDLPRPVNSANAKSTIVLVDDQQDLLETVALMLKELGYECISCVDPKIALDVIGDQGLEIDLVITDYSMPGISGLDIRQFCAKHRPNVPVILSTGYSERVAQDDNSSNSSHYVLNKPFGFNELKNIIDTALVEQ